MTSSRILSLLPFPDPTEEQRRALVAMEDFIKPTNPDHFLILCGAAGTGKTSITSAFIRLLKEQNIHHHIAAPTGRAARILGNKTNAIAGTLHSLMYTPESDRETGAVTWRLKGNRTEVFTVFIIDEASMIKSQHDSDRDTLFKADDSMLNHLIRFVRKGNANNKLVLLGDSNQLPPVDEGESLALDPEHLMNEYGLMGSYHYLKEVKRVEEDSYLLRNAMALREAIDGQKEDMPEIQAHVHYGLSAVVRDFVRGFNADDFDAAIAIGRSHKGNRLFNGMVREHLFGLDAQVVEKGDLLMVLQNWKREEEILYNGDHVLVEDVDTSAAKVVAGLHFLPVRLRVPRADGSFHVVNDIILVDTLVSVDGSLPREKEFALRAARYKNNDVVKKSGRNEDDPFLGAIRVGYGYSITCQKAQGGEWDKVYVNLFGVNDKKWIYTALTRAKRELHVFGKQ
jgi:exodeoxyribonuclease-5